MGDPAGIGLEIALKLWREAADAPAEPPFAVVLYGCPEAVAATAARAGMTSPARIVSGPGEARDHWPGRLPVVSIPLARPAVPGRPDTANAPAVVAAIEQAVNALTPAIVNLERAVSSIYVPNEP